MAKKYGAPKGTFVKNTDVFDVVRAVLLKSKLYIRLSVLYPSVVSDKPHHKIG